MLTNISADPSWFSPHFSSTNFWLKDIAQTIHDVFVDQGYKISVRDMPDWALTIASKINKSAKFVSSSVGKIITYDTNNVSLLVFHKFQVLES